MPALTTTTNSAPRSLRRVAAVFAVLAAVPVLPAAAADAPPATLAETGLYADFATRRIAAGVEPYSPQYPLWTDGAAKRRWISLPPGTTIDASNPDAWGFPVGTRLWKEFSFGRPVETRYIERRADGWIYATNAWSAEGKTAVLAPDRGVRGAIEIRAGVRHDLPSRADCRACHEGQTTPVLGFSALQLSTDRDPNALHASARERGDLDLSGLIHRGLLRGGSADLLRHPPRIPAPTPRERAVLGYLHGNCGHCHNEEGPLADLGLALKVSLAPAHRPWPGALFTAVGLESYYRLAGAAASARIAPGDPEHSVLLHRMASRQPASQMPPLGTHIADDEAVALVAAWIRQSLGSNAPAVASAAAHPPQP